MNSAALTILYWEQNFNIHVILPGHFKPWGNGTVPMSVMGKADLELKVHEFCPNGFQKSR
jgi:hypothetical protein